MSSTYGENLKLSIFGQSHGPAIGMTLDGIPAGLPVNADVLRSFMARRAPGNHSYATPRKEADTPVFLSGIVDGYTCGAPIAAMIENTNTRSGDYDQLKNCPRPGHADYTAQVKYHGYQDASGGGHFSGRLTAPMCIAGGLCKQWLEHKGITIQAYINSIADIQDGPDTPDLCNPDFTKLQKDFPVFNSKAGQAMQEAISVAKQNGDSLGGTIRCIVTGLPAGIGEPMFGGMEGRLAQALYAIPAVKAVEFGSGFESTLRKGSENNDAFTIENGVIKTKTNHSGGILGGITNGMPLTFRVGIKPTPSIAAAQQSIDLTTMEETTLNVAGRHDPCIVPRAVPVVEAAAAIAIFDAYLSLR